MTDDSGFHSASLRPTEQEDRMTSLIERLEAASEGGIALTVEVAKAVGYYVPAQKMAGWHDPDGKHVGLPPQFTTSLDAALALAERVLDGDCSYDLFHDFGGFNRAKVHGITDGPVMGEGKAETMPLALCIAILKAVQDDKSSTRGIAPLGDETQQPYKED